ncbi:MAG TPA: SwmB domain-containing protein, partial [Chitinispirillaceae bacterium]|nr:SwmB domain-containing protein [Chitinispirillaceae bacterium]
SMDGITSMDMELYNCIAYRNPNDFGFKFSQPDGTGRTTLRNNISYRNAYAYKGRTRNISDHNTWDSGAPSVSDADFSSLETAQLIRPRKSDGSLPDITFSILASASDLIDAGTNVGLQFLGNAPDIGVFENGISKSIPSLAYESSSVKNTSPSEVEIVYNLTLAPVVPATTCFDVKVNSVSRSISKIILSGKNVYLTLSSPVNAGEQVTLSYNKPASGPLQCTGGTFAESIANKPVVNSVVAVAPVYVSSSVEDASPDKVQMNYDSKLSATSIPPASAFTILVNGTKKTVSSVAIAETRVTLTLESSMTKNDTIIASYTQPSTNPLQTIYGGKAANITNQSVTNNIQGVATGTDDIINNGKTLIFPNPAREYIKIANFDPGESKPLIKFYDLSGKLCQETKLEDFSKTKKVSIQLKSGMYITQIIIGDKVHYTQKLIVVK